MPRRRTWIVIGLSLAVAATRFLALSRSIWDWDEALFVCAMRAFDVGKAHPHAPGFPLYIALAHLVRPFVADDFHALRTVQLLASFLVFPSFFALGRSLRFEVLPAIGAALLFAFLPNIWFYGGTAFSDILAIVLFLAGAACLFFSARDERSSRYFLGTLLFSLSLLVRPQHVLMAFPWFVATWPRVRARRYAIIAKAAVLTAGVVGIGYGIAALRTGPGVWWFVVNAHCRYVARADGFLNAARPAWWREFPAFVIDPFDGGLASRLLFAFALVALVRPKPRAFQLLATFGPLLLFTLFMLNDTGTSRLSMAFIGLVVLLATDGMTLIADVLRAPRAVFATCVIAIVTLFVAWTLPALREVRQTVAPPVRAMQWIHANVPRGSTIFAGGAMPPFADSLLEGYRWKVVLDDHDPTLIPARDAWYVDDGPSRSANSVVFLRPRGRLWALFTRRYFEVAVHRTD